MPSPCAASEFILWTQADKPLWPLLTLPADGTLLDERKDTSGNNNHGVARTADSKPRWDADAGDGLPGVFYDANNLGDPSFDPCDGVVFPDDALVDLPEAEMFFCLNLLRDVPQGDPAIYSPSDDALGSGLFHLNRDTSRSSYRSPSDMHVYVAFGGPVMDCGIVSLDLRRVHILHATASATQRTVSINGVLVHTEDGSNFTGFPRVPASVSICALGGAYDAFASMSGWEREFIVASPINPVKLANRLNYLRTKWNPVATGLDSYVETLVGAGGGGGGTTGARGGGGGGAGAFVWKKNHFIVPGTYPIVVGTGGAAGVTGVNGEDSTFDTVTAHGGGGGCEGLDANIAGEDGGSGGGGSRSGGGGRAITRPIGAGPFSYSHASFGGPLRPELTGAFGSIAGNNGSSSGLFDGTGGGGGGWATGGGDGGAGKGGVGLSNSITGAAVVYGTGGNGDGCAVPSVGSGIGDGGNGGAAPTAGTEGRTVIRYPTANFDTSIGGTITTDGSDTVHEFFAADNGMPTNDFVLVGLPGSGSGGGGEGVGVGDPWSGTCDDTVDFYDARFIGA